MKSPISIVDVDRLDTWSRYRAGMCETCAANCCTMPLEVQLPDLVRLWLVDVTGLKVIADVDRAVLIAARRLQHDLDQAIPPLLRGEQEARGTLVIESTAPKTNITVNGEAKGVAPVTLTLRPGKYEVKAEREKYLPVTRLLAVEANQTATEKLTLLLMPGQQPDEAESLPTLAVGGTGAASGSGKKISGLTVVSVSATAIAAGVAVGLAVAASGADANIRASFDATRGVYGATRAQALAAKDLALGTNIAWGVAAGLGVASIIFLVLDLTRAPEGATAGLVLSSTGVSASMGGRF